MASHPKADVVDIIGLFRLGHIDDGDQLGLRLTQVDDITRDIDCHVHAMSLIRLEYSLLDQQALCDLGRDRFGLAIEQLDQACAGSHRAIRKGSPCLARNERLYLRLGQLFAQVADIHAYARRCCLLGLALAGDEQSHGVGRLGRDTLPLA